MRVFGSQAHASLSRQLLAMMQQVAKMYRRKRKRSQDSAGAQQSRMDRILGALIDLPATPLLSCDD
jgi:hypothetical protein